MRCTGIRTDRAPALLRCEADPSCGPWVPHTFTRTEKKTDDWSVEIYSCALCGCARVWGTVTDVRHRRRKPDEG